MGKSKYIEKVRELFDKSPVVGFKSIERVLNVKGRRSNYAKLLVSKLIKRGEINKIGKGCYTKHGDATLSVFCFNPAYLGLQCALSFHNLWEQETIPIVITSKNVRTGIRKVLGMNVLIRKIKKDYAFGVDYVEEGGFYFPYSDIEKTFIDMVVFREKILSDVKKKMRKKIDKKKLIRYVKIYPKRIQERVLEAYLGE